MSDRAVLERIDSWEHAGLIDAATAERLRLAEEREPTVSGAAVARAATGAGLAVTAVGGGFVLAAWYWLVVRFVADTGTNPATAFAVGTFLPALLLAGAGWVLSTTRRRVGGALLVLAAAHAGVAAAFLDQVIRPGQQNEDLAIGSLVALGAAAIGRLRHRDATTTAGVVLGIGAVALACGPFLEQYLFAGPSPEPGGEGVVPPLMRAAWWLALACVALAVGAWEALQADGEAGLRAGFARFGGAAYGILGASGALLTSYRGGPIEPVVGVAIVLLVVAAFVGLSLRTGATGPLYAAALGIVIALSALNAAYIVDDVGMGPALLLEGLILVGVGVATDRARREVGGRPASGLPSARGPISASPPGGDG